MARMGLFATALVVTGCATRPPALADQPWTSGRLALQVAAHGEQPPRAMSADFDLRGSADAGELRLTSPLGTLVAVATWSPGVAQLQSAGRAEVFTDLEQLAREALGEALPLQALPDWLAGRPWRAAGSTALAEGFEQLGWTVSLAQWASGLLEIAREAAPAVRLRIRLER